MNTTRIMQIGLLVALTVMANTVGAASRYTDKDNALKLAAALDKGVYQRKLITSTFVKSVSTDKYFIKAVLENGAEFDWDINKIRALAREGKVMLRNNQALIFPDQSENKFVVLDKNLFSQRALRSKVYVKLHPESDVLVGRRIAFGIHQFNLAKLLGTQNTHDDHGYRHEYIIDLENGQREKLSLLDAFHVLERGALLSEPGMEPVMRAPYRLTEMRVYGLQETGQLGVGQFGVEMVFDRPIELNNNHFPYRFYENGDIEGRSTGREKFVVEVTLPNAELIGRIRHIQILEYLHNIRVVPDPIHAKRVLMRANIAPEVMTLPPRIDVRDSSVFVSFAKVVDLTVADERSISERDLLTRQEKMLNRQPSPEELQRRQTYREQMAEGTRQEELSRKEETVEGRIDKLIAAIESYSIAAENASSDHQLQEALSSRNALNVRVPSMIVAHARKSLAKKQGNTEQLRMLLQKVATLTRDRIMLRAINELLSSPEMQGQ